MVTFSAHVWRPLLGALCLLAVTGGCAGTGPAPSGPNTSARQQAAQADEAVQRSVQVVRDFLGAFQRDRSERSSLAYLHPQTREAVERSGSVALLLGVQNVYRSFEVRDRAEETGGNRSVNVRATLVYGQDRAERVFHLYATDAEGWRILDVSHEHAPKGALAALSRSGTAQPAPTPVPVAVATPTPGVPDATKAEAVDLLGAAVAERQQGKLGAALDLAGQALKKWPDYPEAKSFAAEVAPQATSTAIAAATAQARAAGTATAQAQTQETAQANAQTTAQARTQATATHLQDQAKTQALRSYLSENFGRPGFKTSWYDALGDVSVRGDTAVARTPLAVGSEARTQAPQLCSALSGFVNAAPNRDLGLTKVEVYARTGELLAARRSLADQCSYRQ